MAVRCIDMDGDGIRCRDLGMKGERGGREDAGKIFEMGTGGKLEDTGVFTEGGIIAG